MSRFRFNWRSPYLRAAPYYALAGTLNSLLIFAFANTWTLEFFARLAWRLAPYRSFPFPYNSLTAEGFVSPEWKTYAGLLALGAVLLSVVVFVVHSIVFGLVVILHRSFGWPRYLQTVRSRLDTGRLWADSARQCWLIWVVAQALWQTYNALAYGFGYAYFALFETSPTYLATNIAAIVLLFAATINRQLRHAVTSTLRPEERRCEQCGYPLRGLDGTRCPECGVIGAAGNISYELRLRPHRQLLRRPKIALLAVVVLLLLAPIVIPITQLLLPAAWLSYVPSNLQLSWSVLDYNPNAWPIRMDATCVIRRYAAMEVVRFHQTRPFRAEYKVWYWRDEAEFEAGSPPDTESEGFISNGGGKRLDLGGVPIPDGGGGEGWTWFYPSDKALLITVYEPNNAPPEIQRITSIWPPASRSP